MQNPTSAAAAASRCASALGLVLALGACSTTHLARPVGRGNTRVQVSAGGPLLRLGAHLPVPITTVGVAHGLYDDLDVHADVHPTALAFRPGPDTIPILGLDLGVAWHPIASARHALTLGSAVYGFTNRADAVMFVDLWAAGGARPLPWLYLHGGFHSVLRVGSSDREVNRRSPWLPSLFASAGVQPVGSRVGFELEVRWAGFTENGHVVAPNWLPIGQLGGLTALFGISYTFPGETP